MQGVPGGRPPPISLSAGGGVERQGSNDPPQFMRALADMHCGTSPQQKMMQEQKRQEWLRQLNEQMSEQRARSLYSSRPRPNPNPDSNPDSNPGSNPDSNNPART